MSTGVRAKTTTKNYFSNFMPFLSPTLIIVTDSLITDFYEILAVFRLLLEVLAGGPSSLLTLSFALRPCDTAVHTVLHCHAQLLTNQGGGLSALWASRRASAQAVTSKWQLRATSPMNTSSSAGENGFSAKNES